jgi:type IV secretion system protein VirB1
MVVRRISLRSALLAAAVSAWTTCGVPSTARATPLSSVAFSALAARCAPAMPQEILGRVARTESDLDPWALHDNTTGIGEQQRSLQAALTDALAWIGRGDSVDLGLMQINSANLAALGMTARAALDPCVSLAGGAAVLQAAYGGGKTSADRQAALLMALSRYNTGSPFQGIMNGYARRVMANDPAQSLSAADDSDDIIQTDSNAPPPWNIWATASYAQTHGAPWLVSLGPSSNPVTMPVGQPAPASPDDPRVANNQANLSTQPTMRSP